MAKKKTKSVETPKKELDTTLKVGDEIYNINATHSDAAAKVDNALSITVARNDQGNSETVTFDGSDVLELNLVTANGGDFIGDITVPTSLDTAFAHEDKRVLNYTDISYIMRQLTGSTWYRWNESTQPDASAEAAAKYGALEPAITDTNQYGRVGVIVEGTNNSVDDFAKYNEISKEFSLYIYISKANEIYWGTDQKVNPFKVSVAYILEPEKVGSGGAPAYTAKSLYDTFNTISSNISTINSSITNITTGNTVVGVADRLSAENGSVAGSEIVKSIDELEKSVTGLVATGDTTKVKSAENADKLGNKDQSYYQKKITISPDDPSGGANGDIWIKY